jgi:hypothetical protein
MRRGKRKRGIVRRALGNLHVGLMYIGAFSWPSAELISAIRAAAADNKARSASDKSPGPGRAHPERVTPYAELPAAERQLLGELAAQFKRENEK